jgi:hypothetical protein
VNGENAPGQPSDQGRRTPWLRRPTGPRNPPSTTFPYRVRGKNRSIETEWERLIVQYRNEVRACFDWLASHPTHRLPGRCEPLKGKYARLGLWQYEVGGGCRVWYRVREEDRAVVVTNVWIGHPKLTEASVRR